MQYPQNVFVSWMVGEWNPSHKKMTSKANLDCTKFAKEKTNV
jgi:hypothetical protein